MLDKILAALRKAGIIKDEDADKAKDALKDIDMESDEPIKINTSSMDSAAKETINTLVDTVNSLKQNNKELISALNAEKEAREKAIETQQERQKKEREKRISDLVKKASDDKKITEAKKEWFQKFAGNDPDAAEDWLKDAPVDPKLADDNSDDKDKDKSKDKSPFMKVGANSDLLKSVQEQSTVE